MSPLKNIQTKIGFWFHKNYTNLTFIMFVFTIFAFVYFLVASNKTTLILTTRDLLALLPLVVFAILFVFFSRLATSSKIKSSENYLIVIDLAEKLCQKICDEGKMTGEISAKLSILTTETRAKKDSKELTVWMINYYAYEKYQKSLEEKREQLENLQNLSIEISEMERLSKTLLNELVL